MPQKKERNIMEDVDNIKTRKTLRRDSQDTRSWGHRFWAWIIDSVVITTILGLVYPFSSGQPAIFHVSLWAGIALAYWSVLDSNGRQSLGKKTVGLKLTTIDGDDVGLKGSFVSAFGKTFLLPFDFVIGVLAKPGEKQRLFNIASDTMVVEA